MRGLREPDIVDPPERDARHRVPEREREEDEQHGLADVILAKPPVGETEHGGEPDAGERGDDDPIACADWRRLAMPPESGVGQRASARRRAAATKVYVSCAPTVV
jgi:hypothetical protein